MVWGLVIGDLGGYGVDFCVIFVDGCGKLGGVGCWVLVVDLFVFGYWWVDLCGCFVVCGLVLVVVGWYDCYRCCRCFN